MRVTAPSPPARCPSLRGRAAAVGLERPANPSTATRRRTRRCSSRRSCALPRCAIAGILVAPSRADRPPSPDPVAARGFLNMAARSGVGGRTGRADPGRGRRLRARPRGGSPDQRRVRERQPDRPAPRRQRARCVRRRRALPRARGDRPRRRRASTTSTTTAARWNLGRRCWRAERQSLPKPDIAANTSVSWRRRYPTESWAERSTSGGGGPDRRGWATERVRAGIEASLERLASNRRVDRARARSTRPEGRAAVDQLRVAGHVYEDEGATWFRSTDFGDDKDRVHPVERPADVLRGGHRLPRRQVQPRVHELIYIWGPTTTARSPAPQRGRPGLRPRCRRVHHRLRTVRGDGGEMR